jgi:hypothetical protein
MSHLEKGARHLRRLTVTDSAVRDYFQISRPFTLKRQECRTPLANCRSPKNELLAFFRSKTYDAGQAGFFTLQTHPE